MNEVDVCYFDEHGDFKKRKFERYHMLDNAIDVFVRTVRKLNKLNSPALVTLRQFESSGWTLVKVEKI